MKFYNKKYIQCYKITIIIIIIIIIIIMTTLIKILVHNKAVRKTGEPYVLVNYYEKKMYKYLKT